MGKGVTSSREIAIANSFRRRGPPGTRKASSATRRIVRGKFQNINARTWRAGPQSTLLKFFERHLSETTSQTRDEFTNRVSCFGAWGAWNQEQRHAPVAVQPAPESFA